MTSFLEKKSDENLKASEICIQHKYFNVAVSRLYYAIFQKIKGIICNDSAFLSNYCDQNGTTQRDCFSHGNISQTIEAYLKSKQNPNYNEEDGNAIYIQIGDIYNKRKEADYHNDKYFNEIITKNLYQQTNEIMDFIDKNNI